MKTVKVKLLKEHCNDGRDHKAGDVIELPEEQAAWLVKIKGAELVPESSPDGAQANVVKLPAAAGAKN